MEDLQLAVNSRQALNKGAARVIRRSGNIPAVIYGDGDPQSVSVNAKEWQTRFKNVSGNTILTLNHEDKNIRVLVKDTQDDILSNRVMHIDFYAIKAGKILHTMVPIHLIGNSIGVREGGILEQKLDEIEVACLPKDLPSHFELDVSELEVGDSLHVSSIDVPESVEVRTEEELTVVVITQPSSTVEPTDEEGLEEGEGEEEKDEEEGSED